MPSILPSGIIKLPPLPSEDCLPGGRAVITLRPDFGLMPLLPVLFDLGAMPPNNIDALRGLYVENNHVDANGNLGSVSITALESGATIVVPAGAVLAVPLWLTAYGVLEISATPGTAGQSAGRPFIMLFNFPVVPFYISE